MDVSGAIELYVNRQAREIADVTDDWQLRIGDSEIPCRFWAPSVGYISLYT